MRKSQINDDFYVSEFKGYSDYHFMPRNNYVNIGQYREDLDWEPTSEHEYQVRSYEKGYRRAMHKHPACVINAHTEGEPIIKLKEPLTIGEYKKEFSNLDRPCSNEELLELLNKKNKISDI